MNARRPVLLDDATILKAAKRIKVHRLAHRYNIGLPTIAEALSAEVRSERKRAEEEKDKRSAYVLGFADRASRNDSNGSQCPKHAQTAYDRGFDYDNGELHRYIPLWTATKDNSHARANILDLVLEHY